MWSGVGGMARRVRNSGVCDSHALLGRKNVKIALKPTSIITQGHPPQEEIRLLLGNKIKIGKRISDQGFRCFFVGTVGLVLRRLAVAEPLLSVFFPTHLLPK